MGKERVEKKMATDRLGDHDVVDEAGDMSSPGREPRVSRSGLTAKTRRTGRSVEEEREAGDAT